MNSNSTCMRWLAGLLATLALPCAAQPASQPATTLPQVSPAVTAVHDMARAADQLQRSDAGEATQLLQADALEQLRRILDAQRKQQQQSSSKQPSAQQPSAADSSGSQQQNGQNGSGNNSPGKQGSSGGQKAGQGNQAQPGSGQQMPQGGSQAAGESYLPGEQAPGGATTRPSELGKVEAWGFLPPDQRRQVLQGMQAEPPVRYRKLTERYWRMLNESGGRQE